MYGGAAVVKSEVLCSTFTILAPPRCLPLRIARGGVRRPRRTYMSAFEEGASPTQTDVTGIGGTTTLTAPSPTDTEGFYRLGVRVP